MLKDFHLISVNLKSKVLPVWGIWEWYISSYYFYDQIILIGGLVWWFGFLGSPYERDCCLGYLEVPLESQTTNPNHQLTIINSWYESTHRCFWIYISYIIPPKKIMWSFAGLDQIRRTVSVEIKRPLFLKRKIGRFFLHLWDIDIAIIVLLIQSRQCWMFFLLDH